MTETREGLFDSVSKYRAQIMGFAALWIFFFHVRNEACVFRSIRLLQIIEVFCDSIGFSGVDMFLFLSGWGLYHAIKRYNLLSFYKRRFRRLIPSFLIYNIVIALFAGWGIMKFISVVTGWAFLTGNNNETLWFIPAIAIFYLFYPLYYKVFEKAANKYVFTLAVFGLWFALAAAGNLLFGGTSTYLFITRIPVFTAGNLAGWYTFNRKDIKKEHNAAAWAVLFLMLVIGVITIYPITILKKGFLLPGEYDGLPSTLIGIPMCFILARVFSFLGRISLIQKAYGFLGKITLEFYAAQSMVIHIFKTLIVTSGASFNDHLYVLIVLLLSLGGAYLINLVFTVFTKLADGEPVFAAKEKK